MVPDAKYGAAYFSAFTFHYPIPFISQALPETLFL
jgi:hypothetical protein